MNKYTFRKNIPNYLDSLDNLPKYIQGNRGYTGKTGEKGLKGCTTFRFNPEAFQGVLVTEKDLENTSYKFTLDDGQEVEVKGNEEIEYDGEVHSAANLYDALKEGYYGKF